LPSAEAVTAVLLGEAGIADRLKPGQIVVDTSTITYGATVDLANALEVRGVRFVDAPVSGMEARARDATLTIMCGGDEATFRKIEPYLGRMGDNILFMGRSGSGQLTKLINQLLFDINAAALAEILPMAVKMGLDPEKVGSVVNSGTGRSYASEFFIPRVLEGNFAEGYAMRNAYKDLVSAAELGGKACIPMPVLAAATATYQMALLQGHGDKDKGGMIHVFEGALGVEFRKQGANVAAAAES
jgi:3-hydroxyisobutyrate dehydrogenase-like beta-hydroxyacid dehydrogenase